MAASLHPELELRMKVDEDVVDSDGAAALERRLSEVAPALVERVSSLSTKKGRIMFVVTLEDGGAFDDPLWHDAMVAWLSEAFESADAALERENEARINAGECAIDLDEWSVGFADDPWIAFQLEGDTFSPTEAAACAFRAHDLLDRGAFGADVLSVSIPACDMDPYVAYDEGELTGVAESKGDLLPEQRDQRALDEAMPTLGGSGFASDQSKRDAPSRRELDEQVAEVERELRAASLVIEDGAMDDIDADDEAETAASDIRRERGTKERTAFERVWEVEYRDGTSVLYDSVILEVVPRW